MKLANNIKYFRDQNNLDQDDLANLLNISRSTISKWETGNKLPDIQALEKMSHIFKVSIDHLIGNSFFKNDILREVNRIYRIKDSDANERMLQIIDYIRQSPEIEKVVYEIAQLPPSKRKNIEEIINKILKFG